MKFIKNRLILIIIIAIVILIIVGIILFLNSGDDGGIKNSYEFDSEESELPGTVEYNNEKLSSKHCLNGICISDVTFYYNDEVGRVEYTITNTSIKEKSGYLKMVFDDQSLIVVYNDLGPKKSIKSQTQYMGMEIKNKEDYKLEKLTKKEISKIVK